MMTLGYIVFAGCFSFPFGNILFLFDLSKAFLIMASYGAIALGYAAFMEKPKEDLSIFPCSP